MSSSLSSAGWALTSDRVFYLFDAATLEAARLAPLPLSLERQTPANLTGAVLTCQDAVSIHRVDRHLRARQSPRHPTARYELAHLIGGSHYEPAEENPMLGFRGALSASPEDGLMRAVLWQGALIIIPFMGIYGLLDLVFASDIPVWVISPAIVGCLWLLFAQVIEAEAD